MELDSRSQKKKNGIRFNSLQDNYLSYPATYVLSASSYSQLVVIADI